MDALLGQMVGRYQVQSVLSQGRLGNVYQAVDVNLERPVALKVLLPALSSQPAFAARFAHIARLAVRLDHPGLVRVYDFGQANDQYFVAMELLAGPTLATVLASLRSAQQWITVAEARQLVEQVGEAVDAAQPQPTRRWLITPDKIMFRRGPARPAGQLEEYQSVVIDLGLAALHNEANLSPRPLPQQLLAYLAPEVLLRNNGDARSEIYMFGALFYSLVLGQPPLAVETVGQAVDAHLHQTIPLPQTLVPDLSPAVVKLLQRAMAFTPDERYLTLRVLLDALAALPLAEAAAPLPTHATAGVVNLVAHLRHNQDGATAAATLPLRASTLPVVGVASRSADAPPPRPTSDLALPTLTLAPYLQMIAPDGTMQMIELSTPILTIGRVADNDLVLDDPRVSRRHARIKASGNQWQVVDLQSANGTFIGKQRVPAGSGLEWDETQPLHIGSYRLRLVRDQVGLVEPASASGLSFPTAPSRAMVYLPNLRREVEKSAIHSSSDGGVGLYLVERAGAIDPGSRIAFSVILLNQQTIADTFLLAIRGVPADWVQPMPARYEVPAGEQQQLLISLEPPRSPQTRPNLYPLRLEVTSQGAPEQRALGEIELTVKPFVRFRAEVQPSAAQVGETLQIQIENQGNSPQTFALQWEDDPPGELTFAPALAELQIPPGMSGTIELYTASRKQRWLGGPREHLLQIQISTAQHTAQHLVVKLTSRGRLR